MLLILSIYIWILICLYILYIFIDVIHLFNISSVHLSISCSPISNAITSPDFVLPKSLTLSLDRRDTVNSIYCLPSCLDVVVCRSFLFLFRFRLFVFLHLFFCMFEVFISFFLSFFFCLGKSREEISSLHRLFDRRMERREGAGTSFVQAPTKPQHPPRASSCSEIPCRFRPYSFSPISACG